MGLRVGIHDATGLALVNDVSSGAQAAALARMDEVRDQLAAALGVASSNAGYLYPASFGIWANPKRSFDDYLPVLDGLRDRGITPMFNWSADWNDVGIGTTWKYRYWQSSHTAYWDDWAQQANAWRDDTTANGGRTAQCMPKSSLIIMRVNFEMNCYWMPWNVGSDQQPDNSVAYFKAAWAFMHDRVRTTNDAKHVRFHFCPNYADQPSGGGYTNVKGQGTIYPGDAYVEYSGCDAYDGPGDGPATGGSLSGYVADHITAMGGLATSKRIIVGEHGSRNNYAPPQDSPLSPTNNDSQRVAWIQNAALLQALEPRVLGACYFDLNLGGSTQRWGILTSDKPGTAPSGDPSRPVVISAYATMANANRQRFADTTT